MSTTAMSTLALEVPAEVWIKIVSFLRDDLREPSSIDFEAPAELPTVSRVCRWLRGIVEPMVYERIVLVVRETGALFSDPDGFTPSSLTLLKLLRSEQKRHWVRALKIRGETELDDSVDRDRGPSPRPPPKLHLLESILPDFEELQRLVLKDMAVASYFLTRALRLPNLTQLGLIACDIADQTHFVFPEPPSKVTLLVLLPSDALVSRGMHYGSLMEFIPTVREIVTISAYVHDFHSATERRPFKNLKSLTMTERKCPGSLDLGLHASKWAHLLRLCPALEQVDMGETVDRTLDDVLDMLQNQQGNQAMIQNLQELHNRPIPYAPLPRLTQFRGTPQLARVWFRNRSLDVLSLVVTALNELTPDTVSVGVTSVRSLIISRVHWSDDALRIVAAQWPDVEELLFEVTEHPTETDGMEKIASDLVLFGRLRSFRITCDEKQSLPASSPSSMIRSMVLTETDEMEALRGITEGCPHLTTLQVYHGRTWYRTDAEKATWHRM